MNNYFAHQIEYGDLQHHGINISKQRLIDIVDNHIYDFITVNDDRYSFKNWAISGTKFVIMDNGVSFARIKPFYNHYFHCIPLFCVIIIDLIRYHPKRLEYISFCRFNRESIAKLEKVGPKAKHEMNLGVQLQSLIKSNNELNAVLEGNGVLLNANKHHAKLNLITEESLNGRVKYVLDMHNKCYQKYGKSIYI